MKTKIVITAAIGAIGVAAISQSCMAVATSSIGLSIIKRILTGGINNGLSIFKDEKAFLANDNISQAMPSQLRSINNTLESLGLGSVVKKEKEYIAKAASFTASFAEPILLNGVNSITAEDVTRIANGGSGTATQILKEKTESQLIAALTPKVDAKLNEYGIVKTINTALKGNNLLSGLLGQSNNTASTGISSLASQQLVNGLFSLIGNYERQNTDILKNTFNKK